MLPSRHKSLCKPLPSDVQKIIRSGVIISGFVKCVEELVYNSIDAKATIVNVSVNLENFRVKVEDNGNGLAKEDLMVIGKRYHTSKVRGLSDLSTLQSYGYRGEALASIIDSSGSVEIMSKAVNRNAYTRKFKDGRDLIGLRAAQTKMKTSGFVVYIENLLARTPVRQRRIEKNIEFDELKTCIEVIGLMNPGVSITLRDDTTGAKLYQTKCFTTTEGYLQDLVGTKQGVLQQCKMFSISAMAGNFLLEGVVSKDSHHSRILQFLFVNKRYVPKSRVYRIIQDQLSPVLGFSTRYSTSSSKGSLDLGRKNSPKHHSSVERFPIFSVNVNVPFQEYNLNSEGNTNKVEFPDLDGLRAAVDIFADKLKHILLKERNLKISQPKGAIGALNKKLQNQKDSIFGRDKNCAKKVAAEIGVQDAKRALQSQPAQRRKLDSHRLSYENPQKKARANTLLIDSDTDKDSPPPPVFSDPDSSDEESSVVVVGSQPHGSPLVKRNVLLKSKPKITHKLQNIHQHNISGLKKRKEQRELFNSHECLPAAAATKRPRFSNVRPEAAVGKAPTSPTMTNHHDADDSPGHESDISKSLSRLSVGERTPKTDPRSVKSVNQDVDVWSSLRNIATRTDENNPGTDYTKLTKNELMGLIQSHPKGIQMMKEILDEASYRGDTKTPANALIFKSRYPPNYMQKIPQLGGSNNEGHVSAVQRHSDRGSRSSGSRLPSTSEDHSQSTVLDIPHENADGVRARHSLQRQCLNELPVTRPVPEVVIREVPKGARQSSQVYKEDKIDKRHGRVFDSQEWNDIVAAIKNDQTGNFSNEAHLNDGRTANLGRNEFVNDRTVQWVSSINPDVTPDLGPDHEEMGLNQLKRISTSSEEQFTMTQIPPSFSQQFPDQGRVDHRRANLDLPPMYGFSGREDLENEQNHPLFNLYDELPTPAQFLKENNDEQYDEYENLRKESSYFVNADTIPGSPVKPVVFAVPWEPADVKSKSKYFTDYEETEKQRMAAGNNIENKEEDNNGSKSTAVSPAVELAVPENLNGVEEGSGSCDDTNANLNNEGYNNNVAPESVLFNNPSRFDNFRRNWLKKVFPEGANKFWSPSDEKNKIPVFGNSELLSDSNCKIGEVMNNFVECEEDLTAGKWREDCMERSRFFSTVEQPNDVPIFSLNSQEIQFFSRKPDELKSSCRFTKEQLQGAVVIGQVDEKFIVAKMSFDTDDRRQERLILFDQHAVHERIRLETLMKDAYETDLFGGKTIACMEVTPAVKLNFTETQVRIMEAYCHDFALMGTAIEVNPGTSSVRVLTVPKCFAERVSKESRATRDQTMELLLQKLLEEKVQSIIQTSGASGIVPKTILNVLKSQACKGAIKFGDALSLDACIELLHNLKLCKAPFQCAHGRPVLMPLVDL